MLHSFVCSVHKKVDQEVISPSTDEEGESMGNGHIISDSKLNEE